MSTSRMHAHAVAADAGPVRRLLAGGFPLPERVHADLAPGTCCSATGGSPSSPTPAR